MTPILSLMHSAALKMLHSAALKLLLAAERVYEAVTGDVFER